MDLASATAFLSSTAAASGLAFGPNALQAAAEQLAGSVERDPAGAFVYSDETGAAAFRIEGGQVHEIPVQDHIARIVLTHAQPIETRAASGEPVAQIVSPSPHARDYRDRFGSKATAANDAALAAEIQEWPNPFLPQHLNRTRQTVLRNRFPQLAARLQTEAAQ